MNWEELYLQYSDDVYKFLFFLVGNQSTAEDLTHDTFVRVEKALQRYRGDASYYTWVISIARNVAYDYLRRKNRILFLPFKVKESNFMTETPEDILVEAESVKELYYAINQLKFSYKEVIILRKIQGFSVEESARILGWSTSKVKSTTLRAMEKLKVELGHSDLRGEINEKS